LDASKKYDILNKEAKADFASSIPYIEAAHKSKPQDVDAANMLIKVYTRTEQYDKAKAIKAEFK